VTLIGGQEEERDQALQKSQPKKNNQQLRKKAHVRTRPPCRHAPALYSKGESRFTWWIMALCTGSQSSSARNEKRRRNLQGRGRRTGLFDASTPRCQVLSAKAMARLGARVVERGVALI
jgi:hypothetical protein